MFLHYLYTFKRSCIIYQEGTAKEYLIVNGKC